MLNDDEIYSAVTEGFGIKVKADNLTDEIALKRHEAAKLVAKVQYQQDIKDFILMLSERYFGSVEGCDLFKFTIEELQCLNQV